MTAPPPAAPSHPLVRGLFISIVLNAVVPFLLYRLTKRYFSASDLIALSAATLFPLGLSILDVCRSRTLDPVAVLSLMSIVVSMIAVALGGSTRLLLIRESLFTVPSVSPALCRSRSRDLSCFTSAAILLLVETPQASPSSTLAGRERSSAA